MAAEFDERRLSFGVAAELYDDARPSYPREAARFLLGEEPCRVADLGAGTGIFTRVLSDLGHEVVGIEPDPDMRRIFADRSPGVTVVAGSAERIPLPGESLDAVTAAQAYHWFANEAAHTEIARALRPGGVFCTISNQRDESVDWVAELTAAAKLEGDGAAAPPAEFGPRFAPAERAEFRHSTILDADELVRLVQSRSNYLVADPDEQRRLVAAVRELAARLPVRFELPYVTVARRARRL